MASHSLPTLCPARGARLSCNDGDGRPCGTLPMVHADRAALSAPNLEEERCEDPCRSFRRWLFSRTSLPAAHLRPARRTASRLTTRSCSASSRARRCVHANTGPSAQRLRTGRRRHTPRGARPVRTATWLAIVPAPVSDLEAGHQRPRLQIRRRPMKDATALSDAGSYRHAARRRRIARSTAPMTGRPS